MSDKDLRSGFDVTFEYGGFLFAVFASVPISATCPARAKSPCTLPCQGRITLHQPNALGRVLLALQQRIVPLDNITIGVPFTTVFLISQTAKLLILNKPYLGWLSDFVELPALNGPHTHKLIGGRHSEHLARKDQVRIANLILVGLEYNRVVEAAAVGAARETPKAVSGLYYHKGLRRHVFGRHRLSTGERQGKPRRHLAIHIRLIGAQLVDTRRHRI